MSDVLGTLPDWLTAGASLWAVTVAYSGVEAWKRELRAQGTHATAMEIAAAVGTLHVEFFNTRAPLLEEWEMAGNDTADGGAELLPSGMERALLKRYAELHTHIMTVHNVRGKALAVLGKECAGALLKLTRKARETQSKFHLYCILQGTGDRADPSQLESARSQAFAPPDNPQDSFSVEFEEAFRAVLDALDPFLNLSSAGEGPPNATGWKRALRIWR